MSTATKASALPQGVLTFLQEARHELGKVVWPTRAQTIRLTVIVVSVSVFTALYIGVLDVAFTEAINILLNYF